MTMNNHGIGLVMMLHILRRGCSRGDELLVRCPQGQVAKLLSLQLFSVQTQILDRDGCLLLAHPPILGGATGRVGGINALDPKDAGYIVAIGTVGQLLIEPQGSGMGSRCRERSDVGKAIVIKLPTERLEVLGIEIFGQRRLGKIRGGVQNKQPLAPFDGTGSTLGLKHIM